MSRYNTLLAYFGTAGLKCQTQHKFAVLRL